jgi:hypothetical protein
MQEYKFLIIKAITEVNINALYAYKKKLILYHHEKTISDTLNNNKIGFAYIKCKDKFLNMIKYICRTFPSIVLQSSLLEHACKSNFVEFAKLIIVINKRNNFEVEYDLDSCLYNSICTHSIHRDIIELINSINPDNIYKINYITNIAKALEIYPGNYLIIKSTLNDISINFDTLELFKEMFKLNLNNSRSIEALNIISKYNEFDISIYIDCYIDSISKKSHELYSWCIQYFTKNNYNYADIDIGNINEIFINLCHFHPHFAYVFGEHNVIDISYDDYSAVYNISYLSEFSYIKWIINKYPLPNEVLIELFKITLSSGNYKQKYEYIYDQLTFHNVKNIFDEFDDIINNLTTHKYYKTLYWICERTDKYVMYYNQDTKRKEIIKNNGIVSMLTDTNIKYTNSEQKLECDICIDDKKEFVKLECNHTYCRDCTIKLYNCPMCLKKINSNISFLLNLV